MTFAIFRCISKFMNYLSKEEFLDIDAFVSRRYRDICVVCDHHCHGIPDMFVAEPSLDYMLRNQGETFQDRLFKLIKEKDLDEVEVYKKANISRQLFSKIRSEKDYHPTKNTVFSLAIGMKLDYEETSNLLAIAGYTFTPASKTDLVIQYFLNHKDYNIYKVNEALAHYNLEIL